MWRSQGRDICHTSRIAKSTPATDEVTGASRPFSQVTRSLWKRQGHSDKSGCQVSMWSLCALALHRLGPCTDLLLSWPRTHLHMSCDLCPDSDRTRPGSTGRISWCSRTCGPYEVGAGCPRSSCL